MERSGAASLYSRTEERLNIWSHAGGLILSVVGLVLLVIRASLHGGALELVSYSIFGISLVILYAASTLYHSVKEPGLRSRMRVVDHAAIYILIAGTYTPFCLVTLKGPVGWVIFAISWAMAVTGVVLKVRFTGRYHRTSTAMYVFMGWIMVFAIKPLAANLSPEGLFWLVAGGVTYTLGAVFFSMGKLKLNHAIFHFFVVAGSVCHFIAVYFYVLPA